MPWAVEFVRLGDHITRLPTQLFESVAYLISYIVLHIAYWKYNKGKQEGYLFGLFLILVFGFRFFIEFYKENQEAFEEGMALNMGQWLSIPLVLFGAFMMWRSSKNNNTAA